MTPEQLAAWLVPALWTVVLVFRGLKARLVAPGAAPVPPVVIPTSLSLEDLRTLLVEVEDLRKKVEEARGRITELEDRLDKRDRRVGFLEGRVDELSEAIDERDREIAHLRAQLADRAEHHEAD